MKLNIYRNLRSLSLCFLLFVLVFFSCHGQTLNPLALTSRTGEQITVTKHCLFYKEKDGSLSVDSARILLHQGVFSKLEKNSLLKSWDHSKPIWVALKVKNEDSTESEWILAIGNHRTPENVEGWVIGDSTLEKQFAGSMMPYSKLTIKDRLNAKIGLNIQPGEEKLILFKAWSKLSKLPEVQSTLEVKDYSNDRSTTFLIAQSLILGGLLMFFLYHISIYFQSRDKAYLYFSLFVFFEFLTFFILSGFSSITITREHPDWALYANGVQHIVLIYYLLFINQYLNLEGRLRKWIIYPLYIVFVFIILGSVLFSIARNINLANLFSLAQALLTFVCLTPVSRQIIHNRDKAGYYIVGGFAFLVGSHFAIIIAIFIIGTSYAFGHFIAQIGITLNIFTFALGLGYRFRQLEIEKRNTQKLLIKELQKAEESQKITNIQLQQMVKERTIEIEHQKEEILKKSETLEHQNREKELMLSEIHHRVKNNLQMIISMLNIQSRKSTDQSTREELNRNKDRLSAMAIIHQQLYQGDEVKLINLKNYVHSLIHQLLSSYNPEQLSINPELNIVSSEVDFDMAISIGLIVNELVSNSIKHAYHEIANPKLSILLNLKDYQYILEIKDNGKGFEPTATNGFGIRLVRALITELDGNIEMNKNDRDGFQITVIFPMHSNVRVAP